MGLGVAALVSACASLPSTRSADATLNALVEEYFDRQLELSPLNATAIGDTRYDDRLDETTSPGFREKALGIQRAFLDRARRIDAAGLSPSSRITWEIFVGERELALEGQKFPEELMPLNQMSGLPMDLAVYGSGSGPQPFANARDYDRFLTRVRQFPRWADGAIAQMREGMARGITVPRPAIAKVIPQLRDLVTPRVEDSIFWAPVDAMPKGVSTKDRERHRRPPTARRFRRKCCRPIAASPTSSRRTIYPPRAPRSAGRTCRAAASGIAGACVSPPP